LFDLGPQICKIGEDTALTTTTETGKKTKQQSPAQTALQVLSNEQPQNQQTFQVGERTYMLKELDVVRTLQLGDLIFSQAQSLAEAGLLDEELWRNFDPHNPTGIMPSLLQVWKRVPEFMAGLLAIILSGEQPDDGDYIVRNMKLRQLLAVIKGFVEVNAWEDLVEDFFGIRETLAGALAQLQTEGSEKPATS
jgi:hypothetical protein